jgi:hypothetical protein
MIKLKPIVEGLLLEADEQVTWGDVARAFDIIKNSQNKQDGKDALYKSGKIFASFAPGFELISGVVGLVSNVKDVKDIAKALFSLGKKTAEKELKNPKSSEFKKLTGPFWDAIKLSPELSLMLDDQIEAAFINTVILPKIQQGGNEDEPLPNIDLELANWLNDSALTKTDVKMEPNA